MNPPSLKWFCWHSNVFRALQITGDLMVDLDVEEPSVSQAKLLKAVGEFDGYLRANAGRIPNYGERRRAGEAISAQCSGPCHQPQTGLLFLVSGAPEISPETGHATENGVKQNLLTCEDALLWGW